MADITHTIRGGGPGGDFLNEGRELALDLMSIHVNFLMSIGLLVGDYKSEWVLMDSARTCPFSRRREQFMRSATMQGGPHARDAPVLFTAAELVIDTSRRVCNGIQLGGMRFYISLLTFDIKT